MVLAGDLNLVVDGLRSRVRQPEARTDAPDAPSEAYFFALGGASEPSSLIDLLRGRVRGAVVGGAPCNALSTSVASAADTPANKAGSPPL